MAPIMMLFLAPLRVVALGEWLRETADGVVMSTSAQGEAASIVKDPCFSEGCWSVGLVSRPIEISMEATVTVNRGVRGGRYKVYD